MLKNTSSKKNSFIPNTTTVKCHWPLTQALCQPTQIVKSIIQKMPKILTLPNDEPGAETLLKQGSKKLIAHLKQPNLKERL